MTHEAIIIGGNHHNGLGLARILGINGVRVHAVVVDECKDSFLRKSKYIYSCIVFRNIDSALDYIKQSYANRQKYVVIPYSDVAAHGLDNRLNEFEGYHIPSIGQQQGLIAKLMQKNEQCDFAKNNGIKMAKTWVCSLKDEIDIPRDIVIPCIVKPVISSEGNKKDIRVCRTIDQLRKCLCSYKTIGYCRVLVQEYLKIDYEVDVFGCTLKQSPYICLIPTKTIRSWPPEGGTNSFSQIITDWTIVDKCRAIIKKLEKSGFYGLYDIELFVVGDEVLLNEINYRNSGDVYMGIQQEYYYPYAWFLDCIGEKVDIGSNPHCDSYAMTEFADFRNVLKKRVKLLEWIDDFGKTKDFALFFKGDMRPAFDRSIYYMKQFFCRKKM